MLKSARVFTRKDPTGVRRADERRLLAEVVERSREERLRAANHTSRTVNRRYEAFIRATAQEIEPVKIWTIICARLFVWRNLIGTAGRLGPAAPQAIASPSDLRSKGAACL
jgi:hypothetical protein